MTAEHSQTRAVRNKMALSYALAIACLGTYQFFTVFGLTFSGVDKTSAVGFSVIVFMLLSTHLWILGFWAFGRSGLTLFGLRNELSKSAPGLNKDS